MNNHTYTIALVGNPNCGKTTLFNALTGSRCQVGNRMGVTIDCKEGTCKQAKNLRIVDLPGIYSLISNSAEETIADEYIKNNKPDLILNIIDATNIERNLHLTAQLTEYNIPMILAVNMVDTLPSSGIKIDYSLLEQKSGITTMPISASKSKGIDELVSSCLSLLTSDDCQTATICTKNIKSIVKQCVTVSGENRQFKITERIDSVMTHPIFAIPLFLLVMFVIFNITFGSFGSMLSDFMDNLFNIHFAGFIENCLNLAGAGMFIKGLVIDGIIAGIGSVVSFFPQIMLLFLFLSFLEDSGYMARTAFIMDKLFMRLGLSGKSFIPMIMGFGCSVPAIMAARTLENKRNRRLTLLLIPFMSCSAKMPVYTIFAAAFFPDNAGIVIFSLYVLGVILGIISGIIFSRTIFKGDNAPLILELPPYRMPTLKYTMYHVLEKIKDFAIRAGTTLFIASIVIWFMQNFDTSFHMVTDSTESILGKLGQLIAPIFTPCGFGSFQSAVSLISGLAAKETVISTMSILYSASDTASLTTILGTVFNPASAYAFLVFVLLYVPCIASVSALASEINSKRLVIFSVVYQILIAWIMSMLVFQIGSLFV